MPKLQQPGPPGEVAGLTSLTVTEAILFSQASYTDARHLIPSSLISNVALRQSFAPSVGFGAAV